MDNSALALFELTKLPISASPVSLVESMEFMSWSPLFKGIVCVVIAAS